MSKKTRKLIPIGGMVLAVSCLCLTCVNKPLFSGLSFWISRTIANSYLIPLASLSNADYLKIGEGRIAQVAYSPNGKVLGVITSTGLRLYDIPSYQTLVSVPTASGIDHLSWSPDGQFIAVSSGSKLDLLDAATGEQLRSFENSESAILGDQMAWSPDGNYFASTALRMYHAEAWIWEASSGARVAQLKNPNRFPFAEGLAWSPGGEALAVSYHSENSSFDPATDEIYIWDLSNPVEPKILRQWDLPTDWLGGSAGKLGWSADGKFIVESASESLRVFDPKDGALLTEASFPDGVEVFALSPDGNFVAVGTAQKPVIIYELPSLKKNKQLKGLWNGADSLSWLPTSEVLVASDDFDDSYYVWSVSDGSVLKQVSLGSNWIDGLRWSPDSRWLAAGGRDNRVYLYTRAGELIRVLGEPRPGGRTRVDWAADGQWLAWPGGVKANQENFVQIWSAAGEFVDRLPVERLEVPLAWSPRNNQLALVPGGGLQIWEVATDGAAQLLVETTFKGEVNSLDWSPAGANVVVGVATYNQRKNKSETKLVIRQASDLSVVAEISPAGMEEIRSLAWSPNGEWIAASYYTDCWGTPCAKLEVWSVKNRQRVKSFGIQDTAAWKLSWSADSQWIVSTVSPTDSRNVTFYPLSAKKRIREIAVQQGVLESVDWSPDGTAIASAGVSGQIFIWKAEVLTSDSVLTQQ